MGTKKLPQDAAFKKQKLGKTAKRRKELEQQKRLQEALTSGGLRNDLIPECTYELRPVSSLNPPERRVRKLDAEQLERVTRSIACLGFIGAILVRGDRIVDGVVRHEAARQLGLELIPCLSVDHLSDEEARLATLSVNRVAELGAWSFDELKIEMEELLALSLDITIAGFSDQEIDILVQDEPTNPVADEADTLEPPEAPVSLLGDVFHLDEHRIACADALAPESYETLLRGELVTTVFTDPPFNVKIENNVSGLGKTKHGEFVMASGEMSREEFRTFLLQFLKHCENALPEGGVLFAFMDWRSVDLLIECGRAARLTYVNFAVWDKGAGGMGAFYRSAHELIPIFCKGKAPNNNVELGRHGRDRSNVWRYPGANKLGSTAAAALADHPTPKNVELVEDALLDVTRRGDAVLDPFLGSGTTLIAAENTGRVCRGLELNPGYVDVCIRRWQDRTGKQAIHVATGLRFSELAAQRLSASSVDNGDC
jgi:DNA modification methylase